jgi:hypothetical protein
VIHLHSNDIHEIVGPIAYGYPRRKWPARQGRERVKGAKRGAKTWLLQCICVSWDTLSSCEFNQGGRDCVVGVLQV